MINTRTVAFLAGLALFGTVASAQTPLVGLATAIDGDTIRLGDVRIRIHGIDAPEARQTCLDAAGQPWACGAAATAAMRRMLAAMQIECEKKDKDRYGRTVAVCWIAAPQCLVGSIVTGCTEVQRERVDIGSRMVALGLALDWPRYSHGAYQDQQRAARAEHLGMWAGTFTEPAEWRRTHR